MMLDFSCCCGVPIHWAAIPQNESAQRNLNVDMDRNGDRMADKAACIVCFIHIDILLLLFKGMHMD